MRFSLSTTLVLACALALGAVGCGDDDKPAAGSGGTGGGGTGGGGTGGAGTGGTGGTVEPTVCGGVTCPALPEGPGGGMALPIPIPIPMPAGCCTTDNQCGIEAAGLLKAGVCLEQEAPGMPSTMCEGEQMTLMIPGLPIPITLDLAPCCRPNGECGLSTISSPLLMAVGMDEIALGAGCQERALLAESLDTAMLMTGELTWASSSCTFTDDMDAGVGDDAGN